MPRWDRPLDHRDSPYRARVEPHELPIPTTTSEKPVDGERGIWLYLAKIWFAVLVGGLVMSQAMYGVFALLDLIAG